jgi:hypothetical protein
MYDMKRIGRKNSWSGCFEPGFYEIAFAVELKSFDNAVLFDYAEGMSQKTGPWDYALEDKGNIKKYQLLLPEIVLKINGAELSRTITFIPNEKELDSNSFRGIIGWENNSGGDICFTLECDGYGKAFFYDVDVREIDDFKDVKTAGDFCFAERFWLNRETMDAVKHNWNSSFWGADIDRALDCLKELPVPQNMDEFKKTFSQCPPEIRCDLTFSGCYIGCLCLRYICFKREDDKVRLLEWVDSVTALPHWGIGTVKGADFDNDLTAAFNMFGLVLVENWLPEILGKARRKAVKKKIYVQTKKIVEHAKACRSSWPGSNTQNHAFFGYQTILLGALALLNDYPEAVEWINIATAAFKRFVRYLPGDGSYHEGIGYVPFALYGLIPPLLLLEELTRQKWLPRKWLKEHWKFCDEIIPDEFKTGFYIDDGADNIPTCVPLVFRELVNPEASTEDKKHLGSIIDKISIYRKNRVGSQITLLENFWGMLWNPRAEYRVKSGGNIKTEKSYTYFRTSGFVIVNMARDSKLYFLSGGHTDCSDVNRYGCGHHHPHAGNILFNYQGKWLLSDTGHSLCKRSREHNVLIPNGKGQYNDGYVWSTALPDNLEFPELVIEETREGVRFSVALENYYPPDAGLISWQRTVECCRNKGFKVFDEVKCKRISELSLFWGSDFPWLKIADSYSAGNLEFCSINKDVLVKEELLTKRSKEDWHVLHISPERETDSFTFISEFIIK